VTWFIGIYIPQIVAESYRLWFWCQQSWLSSYFLNGWFRLTFRYLPKCVRSYLGSKMKLFLFYKKYSYKRPNTANRHSKLAKDSLYQLLWKSSNNKMNSLHEIHATNLYCNSPQVTIFLYRALHWFTKLYYSYLSSI
jgi:hypothetical protein